MRRDISLIALSGRDLGFHGVRAGFSDPAFVMCGERRSSRQGTFEGLINAGHQRNRPTLRVTGPEHKPTAFATAALAGIGDLPDTVMDRSVVIRMRRRAAGEKVAAFRTTRDTPALHAIRDRLSAWLQPLHKRALDVGGQDVGDVVG